MKTIERLSELQLVLATILFTFLALLPSLNADLVNWDDNLYITQNPLITNFSWQGVKDIFSTSQVNGVYSPIVLLTWMLDYRMHGIDPWIYHVTNMFWHCLNSVLVFFFILRIGKLKGLAFFAALLFGLHPMHVEPVAWATGRKDLVYAFFFILSLITYIQYCEKRNLGWLVITFLVFVLATLSKASAIILPIILLLMDGVIYKRSLRWAPIAEKLPFFMFSLVMGIWAIAAQNEAGASSPMDGSSYIVVISSAAYGTLLYLVKLIAPFDLSAFHPYPYSHYSQAPWFIYASIPLLVLIIGIIVWLARKNRLALFGIAFFLISMLPLVQLFPVGSSIIAERYTYTSYIGLLLLLGVGIKTVHSYFYSAVVRSLLTTTLAIYIFGLGIISYNQATVWKNSETLWLNVSSIYPDDYLAYDQLGLFYGKNGKSELALNQFTKEIQLAPQIANGYANRGFSLLSLGQYESSLMDFQKAASIDPEHPNIWTDQGIALHKLGRNKEALKSLLKAVEADPNYAIIYFNLASVYEQLGNIKEALRHYNIALNIDNNMVDAYYRKARLLGLLNKTDDSLAEIGKGLALDEKNTDLIILRSEVFFSRKNYEAALSDAMLASSLGAQIRSEYIETVRSQLKGSSVNAD